MYVVYSSVQRSETGTEIPRKNWCHVVLYLSLRYAIWWRHFLQRGIPYMSMCNPNPVKSCYVFQN